MVVQQLAVCKFNITSALFKQIFDPSAKLFRGGFLVVVALRIVKILNVKVNAEIICGLCLFIKLGAVKQSLCGDASAV